MTPETKQRLSDAQKRRWAGIPRAVCSVEGCERQHKSRGFCSLHYNRQYLTGDVGPVEPVRAVSKPRQARFRTRQGYIKVWVPEGTPGRDAKGHVLEHRLVMAAALGREVLPAPLETIHHRNGDRADNRIENLELRVGHHGPGATSAHCHTCSCFEGAP